MKNYLQPGLPWSEMLSGSFLSCQIVKIWSNLFNYLHSANQHLKRVNLHSTMLKIPAICKIGNKRMIKYMGHRSKYWRVWKMHAQPYTNTIHMILKLSVLYATFIEIANTIDESICPNFVQLPNLSAVNWSKIEGL